MFVQQRIAFRLFLSLYVSTLGLSGCGDSGPKPPALGTVQGVVKLDGQPLENAMVEFTPTTTRPSLGRTDNKGVYTLDFDQSHKGAAVGEHSVRIASKVGVAGQNVVEKVPPKYNEKTELKATVKQGDNKIDFDLTSK
jgi:hypothetical protein